MRIERKSVKLMNKKGRGRDRIFREDVWADLPQDLRSDQSIWRPVPGRYRNVNDQAEKDMVEKNIGKIIKVVDIS